MFTNQSSLDKSESTRQTRAAALLADKRLSGAKKVFIYQRDVLVHAVSARPRVKAHS